MSIFWVLPVLVVLVAVAVAAHGLAVARRDGPAVRAIYPTPSLFEQQVENLRQNYITGGIDDITFELEMDRLFAGEPGSYATARYDGNADGGDPWKDDPSTGHFQFMPGTKRQRQPYWKLDKHQTIADVDAVMKEYYRR